MHTGLCVGLREAVERIPSLDMEDIVDVKNARMRFVEPKKVIILEGVCDE